MSLKAQRVLSELRISSGPDTMGPDPSLSRETHDALLRAYAASIDPTFSPNEIDETANALRRQESIHNRSGPKAFDRFLESILERVYPDLRREQMAPGMPSIGWINSHEPVAQSIEVPGNPTENLITVSAALLNTIEGLAHLITAMAGEKQKKDVTYYTFEDMPNHVSSGHEIVLAFESFVLPAVLGGRPDLRSTVSMFLRADRKYILFQRIKHAMTGFAIAHEAAHILNKDLTSRLPDLDSSRDGSVDEYWDRELLADRIALKLLIRSIDSGGVRDSGPLRYNVTIALIAAMSYLDFMNIIDRSRSILESGHEGFRKFKEHPPAFMRADNLWDMLNDELRDYLGDQRVGVIARNVLGQRAAFQFLWRCLEPRILELQENGARGPTSFIWNEETLIWMSQRRSGPAMTYPIHERNLMTGVFPPPTGLIIARPVGISAELLKRRISAAIADLKLIHTRRAALEDSTFDSDVRSVLLRTLAHSERKLSNEISLLNRRLSGEE